MYVRPSRRRNSSKDEGYEKERVYKDDDVPRAKVRRSRTDPILEEPARKDSLVENTDEDEGRKILVPLDDVKATFENIICLLEKDVDADLSAESVVSMLKSLYTWMILTGSGMVVLPSEAGSDETRKMWPQGSKIDTRRKNDVPTAESNARRLNQLTEEYASTVASSVVSSNVENDNRSLRKGSITYADAPFTRHSNADYSSYDAGQPRAVAMRPLPYRSQTGDSYRSDYMSQQPEERQQYYQPFQQHVPAQGQNQRYSIMGQPRTFKAEPPCVVDETPRVAPAQPVQRRTTRKPKVGASSRLNNESDGVEVVFST